MQGQVVRWFGNQHFEDLYIEFWYMSSSSPVSKFQNSYTTVPLHGYAITGAVVRKFRITITIANPLPVWQLTCVLAYVSTGRTACSGNTLSFGSVVYADYSEGYHRAMVSALNNPAMCIRFKDRLDELNQRGL
jgi:hypothetical protein